MRKKDEYGKSGPPTDVFRLETPVQAERVIKAETSGILGSRPSPITNASIGR